MSAPRDTPASVGGPSPSGATSSRASQEPRDYALPLTPYYPTNTELAQISQASSLLIGRCMERFGYAQDVQAVVRASELSARAEALNFGPIGNARRYGLADVAQARRYGYRLRADVDGLTAELNAFGDSLGLGAASPGRDLLLTGMSAPATTGDVPQKVTQAADGTAVPDGGCIAEAERQLASKAGAAAGRTAELVSSLKADSYLRAGRVAEVVAAEAIWVRCMRDRGYGRARAVMTAAEDLGVDTDSARPAKEELTIASADAACNASSRFAEVYHRVEARLQERQVEEHAEELADIRQEKDAVVKAAAAVLAGTR